VRPIALVVVVACNQQEAATPHVEATATAPSPTAAPTVTATPTASAAPSASEDTSWGMIGVLNADGGMDLNAPTAPWGREDSTSHGRLGPGHMTRTATVRQGNVTVNGRLPPEVIQRIVRQSFGRFKLCYEVGLQQDPNLEGVIAPRFVIAADGSVGSIGTDTTTTVSDWRVVECVKRAFSSLTFPQPEGGLVTVIFPITFAPP
jgi:hypothetical protein